MRTLAPVVFQMPSLLAAITAKRVIARREIAKNRPCGAFPHRPSRDPAPSSLYLKRMFSALIKLSAVYSISKLSCPGSMRIADCGLRSADSQASRGAGLIVDAHLLDHDGRRLGVGLDARRVNHRHAAHASGTRACRRAF